MTGFQNRRACLLASTRAGAVQMPSRNPLTLLISWMSSNFIPESACECTVAAEFFRSFDDFYTYSIHACPTSAIAFSQSSHAHTRSLLRINFIPEWSCDFAFAQAYLQTPFCPWRLLHQESLFSAVMQCMGKDSFRCVHSFDSERDVLLSYRASVVRLGYSAPRWFFSTRTGFARSQWPFQNCIMYLPVSMCES